MSDFLLNAHSGWQYVVLLAVIVAIVFSFRSGPEWGGPATRVYSIAAIAVDIQVTLGIILWIVDEGWSHGFLQSWVHPLAGLAALGVIHAFLGRARREAGADSHRLVRTGFIIALVLVVVAIGIGEMA